METRHAGSFEFSDDFTHKLQTAAEEMSSKGLDEFQLSTDEGQLLLVRIDSEAYFHRKANPMMAPFQDAEGNNFIIFYE